MRTLRTMTPGLLAVLVAGCLAPTDPGIGDVVTDVPALPDVPPRDHGAADPGGLDTPGPGDVAADATDVPHADPSADPGNDPGTVPDARPDPGPHADAIEDAFRDTRFDAPLDAWPDAPHDLPSEAADPGPEEVRETCVDLAFGTCATPGRECLCCPAGGPANHCLCSTPCTAASDCKAADRPTCQQPAPGEPGFCAPADFFCCWLCL